MSDSDQKEYGPKTPLAKELMEVKYLLKGETFKEGMSRVANALKDSDDHYHTFREILLDQRFLPGGRVQSAIGAPREVTPYNCFVSVTIQDSMESIMKAAAYAAETMRLGGGIGYDFSNLRPRGANIVSLDSRASGPISFMGIFDAICKTISSAGHRRGAQMGCLRVDHPDIEEFITCKSDNTTLTQFNISVLITDEFMKAVDNDSMFQLRFDGRVYKQVRARFLWDKIMRQTWDYAEPGVLFIDRINRKNNLWYCENIAATNPCVTGDTLVMTRNGNVPISDLVGETVSIWNGDDWADVTPYETGINEIFRVQLSDGTKVDCTLAHKWVVDGGSFVPTFGLKPGDILETFHVPVDTNSYDHVECIDRSVVSITALGKTEMTYCFTEPNTSRGTFNGVVTGQCGEQPLPPHGACLLGSFNLTKYIDRGVFRVEALAADIPAVVRAMDNIIDRAIYPLPEQRDSAISKRRMGLGVTGLANAGEAQGYSYGSAAFLEWQERTMEAIRDLVYSASIALAKEKGAFPLFDADLYLQSEFAQTLPECIRDGIAAHGIRNSHLLSIAPTGTISNVADNVSSGIEPPFSLYYDRLVQTFEGSKTERVSDYAYREWGIEGATALSITAQDHVNVLNLASKYVDSACSKTINIGDNVSWDDFKAVYVSAYEGGASGCTTFRASGKRAGILTASASEDIAETDVVEGGSCTIDLATGIRSCE